VIFFLQQLVFTSSGYRSASISDNVRKGVKFATGFPQSLVQTSGTMGFSMGFSMSIDVFFKKKVQGS
jgi:hypothetical protein